MATTKFPTHLTQLGEHFASGVNDAGEVRGFALSGRHIGITATRASEALREALAVFGGPGCLLRLFVDSGAFSEVEFDPAIGGFVVVKEITDAAWLQRFELYRWAAGTFGPRASLVAPDRVGCQETTLARLQRYAAHMQICASARANIIVPVQKGAIPMSEFFRRASKTLGIRNLIAGVPMQKDATSLADLEELVSSLPRSRPTDDRQGARIHLLGIGPRSPRFAPAVELIKRLRPHAQITSDSATVPSLVGRPKNGKGKLRAYTAAQDKARALGLKGSAVKEFGLIEQGFGELAEQRAQAEDAGWFDEELYSSAAEARAHRLAGYPEEEEPPPPGARSDVSPSGDDHTMAKSRGALLDAQLELALQKRDSSPRLPAIRAFLAEGEIVVDNFAGGGGASSGLDRAIGRSPDIAINHDEEAIAMHTANHPTTRHYRENVWDIDPVAACGGKPVALAWFSPTCTHFSKAKGTALDKESIKIRGLAWVATRWAAAVRPRIICLENVEEFQKWGPLHKQHSGKCCDDLAEKNAVLFEEEKVRAKKARRAMKKLAFRTNGCLLDCLKFKPIKSRIGETFRAFVARLRKLGYVVEWRELRACDYGAPTTRKRLFMVARCDGMPIVWPAPTHGPGRAQAYVPAAAVIDWSIPCPSIFERDTPLKDKTLARIARGIKKFVLENPRPFIVPTSYGDKGGTDVRINSIDEPLRTICGNRGGHSIIVPTIIKAKTYGGGGNDAKSAADPLGTVTASKRGEHALATATLFRVDHGDVDASGKKRGQGTPGLEEPLPTLCAGGGQFAIAVPYLIHRSNGERPEKDGAPGQAPRIYDIEKPLGTIVAGGIKHAACVAMLIKHNGGNNDRSGSSGQGLDKPMDTLATHNTKAVTLAHLIKLRGTSDSHIASSASSADAPMPAISAQGTHIAQVSAFLVRYNGESGPQSVSDPIGTLDTNDRYSLITITINGEDYVIADIGMRMLTPRELFCAQGFKDHKIQFGGNGWVAPLLRSKNARAKRAAKRSSPRSNAEHGKHVALDAQISLGRNALELRSRESSPSSASAALPYFSCPLPSAVKDSARRLVELLSSSDQMPPDTREGTPRSSSRSISPSPGSCSAEQSGSEMLLHVSDATRSIGIDRRPRSGRSITSQDGPSSPVFDSSLETLFSFAADAIASFIREQTSAETSFDLCLTVSDQYEISPIVDGKPMSKTAQIRMCGNSVPPVMSEALGRAQLEVAPQLEAA